MNSICIAITTKKKKKKRVLAFFALWSYRSPDRKYIYIYIYILTKTWQIPTPYAVFLRISLDYNCFYIYIYCSFPNDRTTRGH